jgi:hypothetical protein
MVELLAMTVPVTPVDARRRNVHGSHDHGAGARSLYDDSGSK